MIVNKLDFRAARLSIYHTRTCSDTHDYLFVEWAANGSPWELRDQRRGRAEYSAFGATYILPVDEEAGITLRQFYQRLVDCSQHGQLLFCAARGILLPLWYMQYILQNTFRRRLRLL